MDYQWEFGKVGGIVSPRTLQIELLVPVLTAARAKHPAGSPEGLFLLRPSGLFLFGGSGRLNVPSGIG